ncbi:MAG: D-alanine--D-alanine ligase [Patescibacteria group bacterium]|nr:D-alanine--D-alanine ligase [Patescibacteria group bacterium]MCL5095116.1 D-alanine--D-alanine ligase [Patescibacteria group bacterium]
MKKIKVAVLMGGRTPEYDVSLATGREVVAYLNKEKFEVLPVVISRDGQRWQPLPLNKFLELDTIVHRLPDQKKEQSSLETIPLQNQTILNEQKIDVAFLAMHGPYGEDGTIQGLLELLNIPYTGSGVLASALGMDKIMFRKVLASEKIPFPRYLVFRKNDPPELIWRFFKKPPVFVKPCNQGSSVGASVVHGKEELKKALDLAFAYSEPVLVEEYLKGREISCAVLGNANPQALPLAEILPKNEFFDYEAKYIKGKAEEIVPARLSSKMTKTLQGLSVRIFKTIGARGVARVEFILVGQKPYALEINTLPGLTSASIVPKEAKGVRMSYPKLLEKLIELALQKS